MWEEQRMSPRAPEGPMFKGECVRRCLMCLASEEQGATMNEAPRRWVRCRRFVAAVSAEALREEMDADKGW